MAIKIGLDAGHSASTWERTHGKGIIYDNGQLFEEHTFNAAVVKYAKELAELNGFQVIITQPLMAEAEVALADRTAMLKSQGAQACISFHADYNDNLATRGHWNFYWQGDANAKKLATIWDRYATQILPHPSRGIVESVKGTWSDFHMTRVPSQYGIPAILCEHAFYSNADDRKLLTDDGFIRKCAEVAIRSLCEYFGIVFKTKDLTTTTAPTSNTGFNTVFKERVYAENGNLIHCEGNYSILASDVRWIKFDPSKITMKLVYEKNAKVSDLVKRYGADYGFNFPFFWEGVTVGDTKIGSSNISEGYDNMLTWHEFAYINGKPVIGQVDKDKTLDFLVQTTPMLIENGNPCWDYYRVKEETATDIALDSGGHMVSAERTFIGIDAQGNFILAVADGRTKYDKGFTIEEEALFMKEKGAVNALNGDGGGSSVLCTKDGVVSQNKGDLERSVHHAVLIFNTPYQATQPTAQPTAIPTPAPAPVQPPTYPIMGRTQANELQMITFAKKNNPSFDTSLAKIFIAVGEKYGVRGDMAFCQSILETNWFTFKKPDGTPSDVSPNQNNFAGIGATGSGVAGNSFSTPTQGVTAQIQHLYAYASTDPLPVGETKVDPRFDLVSRGSAKGWEQLNNKWAMNDQYGQLIVGIYNNLIGTVIDNSLIVQAPVQAKTVPQPVPQTPVLADTTVQQAVVTDQPWQVTMGMAAVQSLAQYEYSTGNKFINDPSVWNGKMLDKADNWLVFTMLQRIVERMNTK